MCRQIPEQVASGGRIARGAANGNGIGFDRGCPRSESVRDVAKLSAEFVLGAPDRRGVSWPEPGPNEQRARAPDRERAQRADARRARDTADK